jgi:hypothetical protein
VAGHLLTTQEEQNEIFSGHVTTECNIHGSVHRKNILIYIQQHATLHRLFYLETALRVSRGNTTHHQERKQLYLQSLVFVTPLLLPAPIPAGSSNGVTRHTFVNFCRPT